ncbi:MAG TPA: response regulator [Candidatus Cloacimonadota bacterium]|nr:response regulator [Candidatus Cloacimonadota bacterium]
MARILITEDEQLIAEDLRLTLIDMGHDVICMEASGEEAVISAIEVQPDIIFMDIKLAGSISGIEAAKMIRKKIDVSIIFCSAYGDDKTLLQASSLNPIGYIMKPFDQSEIESLLTKYKSEKKKIPLLSLSFSDNNCLNY